MYGALAACVVGLLATGPATPAGAADPPQRLCTETLVGASDGVRLHTWISRLTPDQPRPVLLEMESYARPGNGCPTFLPGDYYPNFLAPELIDRFTLVHVSFRGTGSSEGVVDLTGPDTQRDVRDVIAWAAAQPWSNGDVVLTGQSGTGFYAYHGLNEPAVRAALIYTSCADMYRCFRRGGTYNGLAEVYLGVTGLGYATALPDRRRLGTDANPSPPLQATALAEAVARSKAHLQFDDYWAARSSLSTLPQVEVPVLYTSEPYDIVSPFDAYQQTPGAHLVLGMGHTSAEGITASQGRHAQLVRRYVDRFVAHYVFGEDNDAENDPRVVIQTNLGSVAGWRRGESVVSTAQAWPLPGTQWTRLYFGAGPTGPAASLNDGTLSAAAPTPVGIDAAPILSAPGYRADLRTFGWLLGGSARTDMRDDERAGLTYTSPVLTKNVELTGPISVRLVATSTAADLDWTVRLTDVWPDGRSEWISDGYLRAALRAVDQQRSLRNAAGQIVRPWHRFDTLEPALPTAPVEYLVDVIPTSNVFRQGHRLRLDILPVANDGPDARPGGAGAVAIHRGGATGSSVLMPLIPARCQDATPLLATLAPLEGCATSWSDAVGVGS